MESSAAASCNVIGVMTGTSIDGMDAAIVSMAGHGPDLRAKLIRHLSRPLGTLADRLRGAATKQRMSAGDFAALAWDFGQLHAEVIADLLRGSGSPDIIAVHGQTVFHEPPVSWQLVNPAPIAARFGCPVVYDLRQADLAIGGQGAPITPAADWVLFRDAFKSRAIVNLGGFCNVTVLPAASVEASEQQVRGFDVCACNQVLDAVARRALSQPFDVDGRAAQSGKVHAAAAEPLLAVLRQQHAAGRSLGTGDEATLWVDEHVGSMAGNDLAASAASAVGRCIGEVLNSHMPDEIIVAGGGARNAALLAELAEAVKVSVRTSEAFGIPAEAREAMCIAVLGHRAYTLRRACSIALPA